MAATGTSSGSGSGSGSGGGGSGGSGSKPAEDKLFDAQSVATLGISLVAMGEDLGAQMANRAFGHMLQYGDHSVRRAVPLAIALLHISNPQQGAVDLLSKLSHDPDVATATNSVFAMGLCGAGTNNSRIANNLRSLASYYNKEAGLLFAVRVSQGLLHAGKGLLGFNAYHSDRALFCPAAGAALVVVMHAVLDFKGLILGKYHYLLYVLIAAAAPRMLITVDEVSCARPPSPLSPAPAACPQSGSRACARCWRESRGIRACSPPERHLRLVARGSCSRGGVDGQRVVWVYARSLLTRARSLDRARHHTRARTPVRSLIPPSFAAPSPPPPAPMPSPLVAHPPSRHQELKPLPVSVRVGTAVDIVGLAGKPKSITGFQTHQTPVLLGHDDRAELATDEYLPLHSTLEGFIVLKKNPEYVPPAKV
jgi:hypothetical protein